MKARGKRYLNRLLFEAGALPYDLLTRQKVWEDHCLEMLSRVPGRNRVIVDAGCGPGVSALAMANADRESRVIGFDISEQMLLRAVRHRSRWAVDVPFIQADATKIPLPSGFADGVTGHSLLYLLPDRASALAEFRRILKPGGAVVLLEPAKGFQLRNVLKFLPSSHPEFALTMFLWRIASGTAGRFTPQTLTQVLESAGFSDVTIDSTLNGLGLLCRAVRRD